MRDLEKFREEQMKDSEFKEYYQEMQPLADLAKAVVGARIERGLTQKELSKLTGIPQADISRLESCEGNPSLKTLRRLAAGLQMQLNICFVPLKVCSVSSEGAEA